MNVALGIIGTACVVAALNQLVPEGMWLWLGVLGWGCCTLTLAFVWD